MKDVSRVRTVRQACSSHMAMWETNHLLLFQASLEWLRDGTVMGKTEGELRMGYTGPLGY